jgi:hypothetical protein
MQRYAHQHPKQPANPPGTLRKELGRIVFDGLLDGLARDVVKQRLRDASALAPEMIIALRRYDSALASVVQEGGK